MFIYLTTSTEYTTELHLKATMNEDTTSVYFNDSSTEANVTSEANVTPEANVTTENSADVESNLRVAWKFLAFNVVIVSVCCVVGVIMRRCGHHGFVVALYELSGWHLRNIFNKTRYTCGKF